MSHTLNQQLCRQVSSMQPSKVVRDHLYQGGVILLQIWLYGYELADTLCVFCANFIYILAGKKKVQFLQPLARVLEERDDLPNLHMTVKIKVGANCEAKIDILFINFKQNESEEEVFKTIAQNMKKSRAVSF